MSGPLAAAFSKLEGYAARLALVVSLARWAENPGTLGIGPTAVDMESLRAGIEIVEWAKNETRRIYVMLSEDDEDRERREVLEVVERRGGSITVRQLQQSRLHDLKAEEAEEILAAMVADGLGRWVDVPPGPKGGRPTRYFRAQQDRSDGHPVEPISCSNETVPNETPSNLKEFGV
ncbi:MAG: DUF3987 domain-containing protein [Planctomycetes bacterium]|nr:DUF3987 domain-containing protein [Planctomycetota bacterium]